MNTLFRRINSEVIRAAAARCEPRALPHLRWHLSCTLTTATGKLSDLLRVLNQRCDAGTPQFTAADTLGGVGRHAAGTGPRLRSKLPRSTAGGGYPRAKYRTDRGGHGVARR